MMMELGWVGRVMGPRAQNPKKVDGMKTLDPQEIPQLTARGYFFMSR